MCPGQSEREAYDELSFYTLAHSDPAFIHQHIVDAFTAQHADATTRPIGIAFALAGLYLHLERSYSGREVQRAHMRLTKAKARLPLFDLSNDRGAVTVTDVLRAPPGPKRDAAIHTWAASVWSAWSPAHQSVADWIRAELPAG